MSHLRLRLVSAVAVLVALLGAEAALASGVIVSEFRTRGPAGAADEFVEIHNAGNEPVGIGEWLVRGSNAMGFVSTRATIPAGTTLAPGCFYLVANSSYSGTVARDAGYTTGITDDGGVGLVRPDGTIADQVGMSSGSAFKEGATLAAFGSANTDRSYARQQVAGSLQDTGDNSSDFTLVTPSGPQNSGSSCLTTGTDPTDPSASGVASPSTLTAGDTTSLAVTVTPGTNPASSGIAATANLSAIGASATQTLFDDGTHGDATAGDNVFSYDATVAESTEPGTKVLGITVSDAQSRTAATSISLTVTGNPCTSTYTAIPAIQGSGPSAAVTGAVTTRGVVVGDHEGASPALRGFYLQAETGDGDPATSDGIFVFNGNNQSVSLGDIAVVSGTAAEFQDQTQISNVAQVTVCGEGTVEPVDVFLPVADPTYLERFEGMLVRAPQTLYVTEHFQLGRFGQVVLSSGDRLFQPTSLVAPGAAAMALQAENDLNRLILDDSSQTQNPDPIVFGRNGDPLSASNTLRGGDTLTGAIGVMTYTWAGNSASGNAYRLRPIGALGGSASFVAANERPTSAPDVGGSLKVVGFNVLNFFNSFDASNPYAPGCQGGVTGPVVDCRGADGPGEFERQWRKTVAAIIGTGGDIVGLGEIENDGYGPSSAIQFLVDKLNEATAAGTWALIDADAGTGQIDALGSDAIKVGLIYKPAKVTPIGTTAALNSIAFENGGDSDPRNRPALAQAFRENSTGSTLVVSPNHLKSKGSACDAPDTGDGQANCAVVRTNAANLLADWLNSDPTGTGSGNVLIVGDLNSYAKEDPIAALEAKGFTNLAAAFVGPYAYSYVFDGQWGYLDYAMGNAAILSQVSGVAEWHINADEPSILDYNENFKSDGQKVSLYAPDEFRVSDHDPVVVGLDLDVTYAGVSVLTHLYVTKEGIADALVSKLEAAEAAAARGNEKAADNILGAYVNQVEAQSGKSLTEAQADHLIALAESL